MQVKRLMIYFNECTNNSKRETIETTEKQREREKGGQSVEGRVGVVGGLGVAKLMPIEYLHDDRTCLQ